MPVRASHEASASATVAKRQPVNRNARFYPQGQCSIFLAPLAEPYRSRVQTQLPEPIRLGSPTRPDNIHLPHAMRLFLAIFLPWIQFFTIGRPFAGLICLILQITILGWIPAAIWSVYALSQYKTDQKIKAAMNQRN